CTGLGGRRHAVLYGPGQVGEPEPGGDPGVSRRRGPDQVRDQALSARRRIGAAVSGGLYRKAARSTGRAVSPSDHLCAVLAGGNWLVAVPKSRLVPARPSAESGGAAYRGVIEAVTQEGCAPGRSVRTSLRLGSRSGHAGRGAGLGLAGRGSAQRRDTQHGQVSTVWKPSLA